MDITPQAVKSAIGQRPPGLADREQWLRATQRLISDDSLLPSVDVAPALHDSGLEL